jgi:hypothetical protein
LTKVGPGLGILVATLLSVAGAEAQQQRGSREGARLSGVVVDAVTERPVVGALVVLDEERRAILTDSAGAFDFGPLQSGPVSLTVRRYGYLTQGVEAVLPAFESLAIEVPLPPEAVLVDGLEVVTERLATMDQRLASRRRALATSTRAFEQDRLVRSASRDFLDFLQSEASLHPEPCGRIGSGTLCLWSRGRLVTPRVYVDEMPVLGGLDMLGTYRPYDMYLVEVYGGGQEIRAYTHLFMERSARRAVALMPIFRWW